MKQRLPNNFLEEFENQVEEKEKHSNKVTNSGTPEEGSWTEKIVSKVRISDLASEFGVGSCPSCDYGMDFDDGRGWFICQNGKYNDDCDVKGNIVDFMERFG